MRVNDRGNLMLSLRRANILVSLVMALSLVGVSSPLAPAQAANPSLKSKSLSSADAKYMKVLAKRVIEDVSDLDIYVTDGIAVSGTLNLLADTFDRLSTLPPPPKSKASKFKAQAKTLANFTRLAASEYESGNDASGFIRYQVIRKQTVPLLAMINKGLKTKFKLPAVSVSPGDNSSGQLSNADTESIKKYAGRIVEDIKELDVRVVDGISMSSRLSMLASSYQSLADGPVPPGSDPADFKSRAGTLASFASQASNEYSSGQRGSGSARYAVLRQETPPLLALINAGLGTSYALP